eukprot:TRINITY_DN1970_c0_g1_i1.p2 TRINITY_DN1970_c0_g1~~TRINITY_DN1970_c0_g1_i1.p2  ORF type:complete len:129 (-),score=19.88 TRINITY_DN1970_c0_g1_i1:25-360(-)
MASNAQNKEERDAVPAQSAQDMTAFVQDLLQQMQHRFQQMSDAIVGRIEEMGSRIDELEKGVEELMAQTGVTGGEGTEGLPRSGGTGKPDGKLRKQNGWRGQFGGSRFWFV